MISIAGSRFRLLRANDVEKQVFKGYKDVKDLVECERKEDEEGCDHGVHEVVVRCRNNNGQDERGVSDADEQVEQLPEETLPRLAGL